MQRILFAVQVSILFLQLCCTFATSIVTQIELVMFVTILLTISIIERLALDAPGRTGRELGLVLIFAAQHLIVPQAGIVQLVGGQQLGFARTTDLVRHAGIAAQQQRMANGDQDRVEASRLKLGHYRAVERLELPSFLPGATLLT
uniref:Putative secreted peptide n=1 Tax=Anopheles braziliensis TaxID=58242 RepID=A0A2M3ZQA1_9DIPT